MKQPDELPKNISFFSSGELSEKTDGLQITICFDYELACESPEVVSIVQEFQKLPQPEQEQRVKRLLKHPRIGRWAEVGVKEDSKEKSEPVIEPASIDDVMLQLVSEGVGSPAKIAAGIRVLGVPGVSTQVVRQLLSQLMEAGQLKKNGRGYRCASPEAPKSLQGTEQREEYSLAPALTPTICLAAAKWFPKPWLTIPLSDRKKLVEDFTPVYNSFQPLSISHGYDSPQRAGLRAKAIASDNALGHRFEVYTMSLDLSEPTTRLEQRFATWLKQERARLKENWLKQKHIRLKDRLAMQVEERSHRGHNKPAELLRALASYRLAKLPLAKRQIMEGKLGIEISDSQISRGKKRIEKLMKFRNYLR
jgi:hypothetical protein